MAVDFSIGTPFAAELQSMVQPKLAEYGWATGDPEDSTIFEYILLMLGNNKDEAQIASELSNDLLDLGPDNVETQQFARWLFEQIDALRRQQSGGANDAQGLNPNANDFQMEGASNDAAAPADTEMEGAGDSASIPTGPKAMRNGSGSRGGARGGRMLNQMNKHLGRNDDPLHRVRGSQGVGRINSHSREPPKGPRGQNIDRGLNAMANGRGMGNVGMAPPMNMNPMNMMNGMPPMGANGAPGMAFTPDQQMQIMQMMENQAQMMTQLLGQAGGGGGGFVNPNFPQNNRGRNGRPLNERMTRGKQGSNSSLPPSNRFPKKDSQDQTMGEAGAANGDASSAMDVEGGRPDASSTMCKFNKRCSKPDCPFVHQSPAAPDGTSVDMNDTCTYGAACKNKKCAGKHPSPAQRHQYQAEQECAFYPHCRDMANCPYKHPSMPPCRNGADCTTPNCQFGHNTTMCKFNPCTNYHCVFKHEPGQKRTTLNKTWTAPKNGEEDKKEHVSERKFIDEEEPEELIIPGKSSDDVEITT